MVPRRVVAELVVQVRQAKWMTVGPRHDDLDCAGLGTHARPAEDVGLDPGRVTAVGRV
jgi:hypothetical protein